MRILSKKNLLAGSVLSILFMLFGIAFCSGTSHALADMPGFNSAPAALPSDSPTSTYVSISNQANDAEGNGNYKTSVGFKIYTNVDPSSNSSVRTIDINFTAGSSCGGKTVWVQDLSMDGNENTSGALGPPTSLNGPANGFPPGVLLFPNSSSTNCGDYSWTLDPSAFVASNVSEHQGLWVAYITVTKGTWDVGTLRFHIGAHGGSKISYAQGTSVMLFHPNTSPATNNNQYNMEFQPTCSTYGSSPTTRFNVSWSDADDGFSPQAPNSPKLDARILGTDGSSYDIGTSLGGKGGGSYGYTANVNVRYKFQFRNVESGNGVVMTVPTDSINYYMNFNCYIPPQPLFDADCSSFSYLNMAPHSKYRFDFFSSDVAPPYLPPPNSANGGQWAGFPGIQPVLQKSATTGSSGDNFFQSMPGPSGGAKGFFILIEHWQHNPDGSWTYTHGSKTVDNCYNAVCSISVSSVLGPNNAIAGNYYAATINITNNGKQPVTLIGWGGNAMQNPHNQNGVVNRFTSASIPMDYPGALAPGSIGTYTLGAFMFSGGFLDGGCSAPVNVYAYFNIIPTANANSTDPENPSTITYNTGGHKLQGPDVSATEESWLTWIPYGGAELKIDGSHFNTDIYGPDSSHNFAKAPPSVSAGDQYCPHARINPASGYAGPGGVLFPAAAETDPPCGTVHNEPYIHVNGDAAAGGCFGDACATVNGGIQTFSYATNASGAQPVGAGAETGVISQGLVSGFSSAILRNTDPIGPLGLTYSNTVNTTGGGAHAANLGGSVGTSHQVPDYYGKGTRGLTATPANNVNWGAVSGNQPNFYKPPGGTALSIPTGSIANHQNVTIYVDGNAYINGPITFASHDWGGDIDSIPSFYLIVRGNIFIAPGVTQLDGVYVAQPNGASGGGIYTCTNDTVNGAPANAPTNWLTACKRQLLVNGAFVSQHVFLQRTFGSLRNSYPGEHLNGVRPAGNSNCGDSGAATNGECAAEVFNFTPEMFLQQPTLPPNSGPTMGKWDSVTSLAPVL